LGEIIYERSEVGIRAEWLQTFEHAKLERERKAQAGERSLSAREEKDGTAGIQLLLYNRAVIFATCGEDAAKNRTSEADFSAESDACVKSKLSELVKYIKLSEYAGTIGVKKYTACEMTSRDYSSEARFAPYDFLRGSDIKLFDFKSLNDCLLSGDR
jgi:hypothetical protein